MNSKGLFYDGNAVTDPYMPVTIDPTKPEFDMEIMVTLMQQCATVTDVLDFIKPYNLSFLNEAQLQFVDANGASVIIEGDSIIRKTGFYQVSTNFYQSQIQNPYENKDEYWRYCLVDSAMETNKDKVTKELMKELCSATSVSPFDILATGYSNICDLKNLIIDFYHMRDYDNPITIDLNEYFEKGDAEYKLYDLYHELYSNKKNYNGLWESDGYGYLLFIDEFDLEETGDETTFVAVCQYTDKSMLFDKMGYIIDDKVYYDMDTENPIGTIVRDSANLLTIDILGTKVRFETFKMETMEDMENFSNMVFDDTRNPITNFEVFWQIYKENCALFELTGVDWQKQYDDYSRKITANTTPKELFAILSEMITPLNDGHSYIYGASTDEEFIFFGGPELTSPEIELRQQEFESAIATKMDNGLHFANSAITYGTVSNLIGYMNIPQFMDYTFLENANVEEEIFSGIIDDVFKELASTNGLIIDLRWNQGGYDKLAITLIQRLVEEEIYAYSFQARNGGFNHYNSLQEIYIEPNGISYTNKPVVVLTSNMSASATDVCAMLMNNSELDNITTMGERTYGIFSDVLEMRLPNGWQIGLSNERYLSDEGINYEQKGITPDIEVFANTDSLDIGIDNIFNEAVRYLLTTTEITNEKAEPINIYPVPFKSNLEISVTDQVIERISILTLSGRQIKRIEVNEHSTVKLDMSDIDNGIYLIKIKTNKGIVNKKVVKE